MNSNNDFLDLGIDYLKEHKDKLETSFTNEPPKLDNNTLQKQKEELEYEKLKDYDIALENMLDEKFDLSKLNYEIACQNLIKGDGDFMLKTLPSQIHNTYTRLIRNTELTKEIKDKKFQNYLSIRRNLEKVLDKIIKSKNPKLNYILPIINIHMKELDKYLLVYIVDLNFRSNKESIVSYIKSRLRKKKK